MEDKLYDALARVLLLDTTDQYGNTVQNYLKTAINRWAEVNQIKIAELVLKHITIEVLAEAIEERVKDAISIGSTERYLSGYDRQNYQEKLNKLILEKVAQMIAEKKLKELTE